MALTCEYCGGSIGEDRLNCANCGAPIVYDEHSLPDFRNCPFCHRSLLALGSPACNYCGRRLPDHYIKAREGDLKRLTQVEGREETSEAVRKVSELIRQTGPRKRGQTSSPLGLIDLTSLIDIFR
jgi:predicted amidophosphoribosyltransferase